MKKFLFFRDSFGENEDSCLLQLQERFHMERAGPYMNLRGIPAIEYPADRNEPEPLPTTSRRKNYIIFEQNDEDTLI